MHAALPSISQVPHCPHHSDATGHARHATHDSLVSCVSVVAQGAVCASSRHLEGGWLVAVGYGHAMCHVPHHRRAACKAVCDRKKQLLRDLMKGVLTAPKQAFTQRL